MIRTLLLGAVALDEMHFTATTTRGTDSGIVNDGGDIRDKVLMVEYKREVATSNNNNNTDIGSEYVHHKHSKETVVVGENEAEVRVYQESILASSSDESEASVIEGGRKSPVYLNKTSHKDPVIANITKDYDEDVLMNTNEKREKGEEIENENEAGVAITLPTSPEDGNVTSPLPSYSRGDSDECGQDVSDYDYDGDSSSSIYSGEEEVKQIHQVI